MDSQAFIAAQTSIMRLSTVAEALEMFAWSFRLVFARPCSCLRARASDCSSRVDSCLFTFRISADITAEQSAGEEKFSMNIVLRR